ncbi:MAG: class IV adenylate cyclase [Phycisphaerales bacterium]|nr:class IV adenylate cyclase [Phycisphaerales bacterium]
MALEIETKLKVDSLDAVRTALRAHHAVFLGEHVETDCIYDLADGSLRRRDIGLRIRTSCPAGPQPGEITLTVKGPPEHGPLKSREEAELRITDAETADLALRLLGYAPRLRYQKRRESFSLRGCRVELDTLPHLGTHVEIEGPDAATVLAVQQLLGLGSLAHEAKSYVSLWARHCEESGTDPLRLDG